MSRHAAPRRGPGVLRHLLSLHLLVLLVPISAILFLDIYQSHLVRQTERRLISESALIAETWREVLMDAEGQRRPGRIQPAHVRGRYFPFAPVIDLNRPVALPEAPAPARRPLTPRPALDA
ncbi:hypothetical protein KJ940_04570, partial [Myxococcota bacterium]|nr:hypothetical protein [Myxococcota bacterium]